MENDPDVGHHRGDSHLYDSVGIVHPARNLRGRGYLVYLPDPETGIGRAGAEPAGQQRRTARRSFEDATGAHAGALLGDVRHDPFQSGGMGTPSHERVEPGSIHQSHTGVLFVDEINTLDVRTQQKLMTAIQEGEFSITGQSERSSGAMVQTEPVPCNFVMIAAGNMDAMENMHPALRSRIKGYGYEVYMDDTIESTPEMRRKYVRFIAQEVERDGRLPHFTRDAVEELILEAKRRAGRKKHLTLHFRDLGGLIRVAGDIAGQKIASSRLARTFCKPKSARARSNNSSPTTTSSGAKTTS